MTPMRVVRRHPQLILLATLAGVLLVGSIWVRTLAGARSTTAICDKVDILDASLVGIVQAGQRDPRPGEYGYDYWLHHPGERANRGVGVNRAVAALRAAACDPNHLPSVRLAP